MRRVITRLLVACCTFTLGISIAALRFETRRPAFIGSGEPSTPRSQNCDYTLSLDSNADPATAAKLPILPYCELVNNPDCYSGKIVRVGARIFRSEHGMFFEDEYCSNRSDNRTAIQLPSMQAEEVYSVLMKTCGPGCYKPLDVVVIGRFEKVTPSSQSDLVRDATALRFEIKSLESASTVR
jgi:hypothetical protein